MKIVIVNTFDTEGGAARAAYRLHQSLLEQDIESTMLVQNKSTHDDTVIEAASKLQKTFVQRRSGLDFLPVRLYKERAKTPFSPAWLGLRNLADTINAMNPDIVHLHWVTGGMLKIEDIIKIKAPIVWSMHDNWLFTGGCHIKWECNLYKNQCGTCPQLNSTKSNDLSRWVWKRKEKTFAHVPNMTIIGLSRWITDNARESNLLKNHTIVNLPNPINTHIFKPFDKNLSRERWNLPLGKKLVLFGAMSATSDINKGFQELSQALVLIQEENIELVIIGSSRPHDFQDFKFKTHYLGHLYNDTSLVALYNAVDIVILPSLQENLSNTIMESLACGTPVAAFDTGGNSDMVEHKKTGYLAKPFEIKDLADGIVWLLHAPNYHEISHNARAKILQEFDNAIVAHQYLNLYRRILNV